MLNLTGKCAFPGKAVGNAVFIEKTLEVPEGSIAVVSNLTPELTPLIFGCKAVVIEAGGILTHGAIVARELEIPCIVGVENAMKLIKENQKIEVDAEKGLITIL